MGQFNDGLKEKKAKRGATNVAARLEGFGSQERKEGSADWGEALPENIGAVVLNITRLGGAVTFGLSRDKGAYSVTLLLDGERRTVWINGSDNLDEKLTEIFIRLDALHD